MRLFHSLAMGIALAALSCGSLPAHADSFPDMETNRLTRPTDTIVTLGSGLFGESVDLYNGTTSFDTTDINIPGNSKLPVSLGRHLNVVEADQYGGLPSFENWEIDVPYLSGYFAEKGWQVTGPIGTVDSTSPNRCSVQDAGSAMPSPVQKEIPVFAGQEYWSGNNMYVPGVGTQEMLLVGNSSPNISPRPTDGNTYYWTTKNLWTFSCLPSVQNDVGEGFLATSPDGTKYYFDRMIVVGGGTDTEVKKSYTYLSISGPQTRTVTFYRQKNFLVASHVVDRFGNTVTYNYNSSNQLTSISANDGRSITLTWTGGHITGASDGKHNWIYQYSPVTPIEGDNGNVQLLSGVTLPDTSAWSYQYAGDLVLIDTSTPAPGDSKTPGEQPTCDGPPLAVMRMLPNPSFTLTATNPSGASGIFQFKPLIRGNLNRPRFHRHLEAILSGNDGGVNEQQALHG